MGCIVCMQPCGFSVKTEFWWLGWCRDPTCLWNPDQPLETALNAGAIIAHGHHIVPTCAEKMWVVMYLTKAIITYVCTVKQLYSCIPKTTQCTATIAMTTMALKQPCKLQFACGALARHYNRGASRGRCKCVCAFG